jgi:hypothetical protein
VAQVSWRDNRPGEGHGPVLLCPECLDRFTVSGRHHTWRMKALHTYPHEPRRCCGCGATPEELTEAYGDDLVAPFATQGHAGTHTFSKRLLCSQEGGWHV